MYNLLIMLKEFCISDIGIKSSRMLQKVKNSCIHFVLCILYTTTTNDASLKQKRLF